MDTSTEDSSDKTKVKDNWGEEGWGGQWEQASLVSFLYYYF